MNFISSWWKTIFYSLSAIVRKILFLPLQNKIQIFAPPCNVLYVCLEQMKNDQLINNKFTAKNWQLPKCQWQFKTKEGH